jgi:Dyp-type peroxidase family
MPGTLQDGIYYDVGQRPPAHFAVVFIQIAKDVSLNVAGNAVNELWKSLLRLKAGEVAELPGHPVPPGELAALIAYGSNLFARPDAQRSIPEALAMFGSFRSPAPTGGGPLLAGSGLSYANDVSLNPSTEDIVIQLNGATELTVARAVMAIWEFCADTNQPNGTVSVLMPTGYFSGFQRDDSRSWLGFHDGISNLRSGDERRNVVAINSGGASGEEWTMGGSYLAFLRVAVDRLAWRRLPRLRQELLVGRDKLSGCPVFRLDAGEPRPVDGCPVSGSDILSPGNDAFREPSSSPDAVIVLSHVQRANHHLNAPPSDPGSLRIFRQGYEFLESTSSHAVRVGLNFVSFQDSPERLMRILTQPGWLGGVNFGGDPAQQEQGMSSLLSIRAGGIFFVPPAADDGDVPGLSIFRPTTLV